MAEKGQMTEGPLPLPQAISFTLNITPHNLSLFLTPSFSLSSLKGPFSNLTQGIFFIFKDILRQCEGLIRFSTSKLSAHC